NVLRNFGTQMRARNWAHGIIASSDRRAALKVTLFAPKGGVLQGELENTSDEAYDEVRVQVECAPGSVTLIPLKNVLAGQTRSFVLNQPFDAKYYRVSAVVIGK